MCPPNPGKPGLSGKRLDDPRVHVQGNHPEAQLAWGSPTPGVGDLYNVHTLRAASLPLAPVLLALACGSPAAKTEAANEAANVAPTIQAASTPTLPPAEGAPTSPKKDDLEIPNFGCILDWPQVRAFRITNTLGNIDASLAVANANKGGVYPVGTLIQLIPQEAMLKRPLGWGPASGDWEFFSLEVSKTSTKILARGTSGVINQFGGDCLECHAMASPEWDFTCESGHGCEDLGLSDRLIRMAQNSDPRCSSKP